MIVSVLVIIIRSDGWPTFIFSGRSFDKRWSLPNGPQDDRMNGSVVLSMQTYQWREMVYCRLLPPPPLLLLLVIFVRRIKFIIQTKQQAGTDIWCHIVDKFLLSWKDHNDGYPSVLLFTVNILSFVFVIIEVHKMIKNGHFCLAIESFTDICP